MESQPAKSSDTLRLLPLCEGKSNEGLANALARLLCDEAEQAETGAKAALLILSGIQTYFDSGGDYLAVERVWEPVIVSRQLEKSFGAQAANKARIHAEKMTLENDARGAWIYNQASLLLEQVIKSVDSKS